MARNTSPPSPLIETFWINLGMLIITKKLPEHLFSLEYEILAISL